MAADIVVPTATESLPLQIQTFDCLLRVICLLLDILGKRGLRMGLVLPGWARACSGGLGTGPCLESRHMVRMYIRHLPIAVMRMIQYVML